MFATAAALRDQSVYLSICLDALRQRNLDAVREQVVLPPEVLLLNAEEQGRVIGFSNRRRLLVKPA